MTRVLRNLLLSVLAISLLIPVLVLTLPTDVIAGFLKVRDSLEPADVIYLLGGDYETRAPAAASLFRAGAAPTILLAREVAGLNHSSDPALNFTEITKGILVKNGVPESAMLEIRPDPPVNSTSDEARVLRAYVGTRSPARVIVLTSALHSRRARMMMSRAVWGRNTEVRIWPAEPMQPPSDSEVRKELSKFIFYWVTFW